MGRFQTETLPVADIPIEFEESPQGNIELLNGKRVQSWMLGDLAYQKAARID
jgi:hypothetical protein